MYLSRKDFRRHGYTDGCTGCRDLASGKQRSGSFLSPHNAACRRRMETAIKTAGPDRWARYLLRRGQEVEAEEEERACREKEAAAPSAVEDGKAGGAEEDDDGWDELFEGLDDDEVGSGSSGLVGSSDAPSNLGAAVEQNPSGQSDDLAIRLCSVDVSEVFSPPRRP